MSSLDEAVSDLQARDQAEERNIIVVTSTYNGKPPDNAQRFFSVCAGGKVNFSKCRFTVFGCGNTQWKDSFQSFPIVVDSLLGSLGGTRVHPRGSSDADGDSWDEDFDRWEESMLKSMVAADQLQDMDSMADQKMFSVAKFVSATGATISVQDHKLKSLTHPAVTMKVVDNEELLNFSVAPRSTRHITLKYKKVHDSDLDYTAGDHLGVIPLNGAEDVKALALRLGVGLDEIMSIERLDHQTAASSSGLPLNEPITVKQLLSTFLDILSPLSKRAVERLSNLTECPPDVRALKSMAASTASFKSSDIFTSKQSILTVLKKFPSIVCTLSDLVDILPVIKPRFYSISSSPAMDSPEIVTITVSRLLWTDKNRTDRHGLCSTYLNNVLKGDEVQAFIRRAPVEFHLPQAATTPIIMVGPGTGIAPFRGFIRERAAVSKSAGGGAGGKCVLFTGCRNAADDSLYHSELAELKKVVDLDTFHAYSRDGPTKVYVQDMIRSNGRYIADLVANGAYIYICGDGKLMAPAVESSFDHVLKEAGVEGGVGRLKKERRYVTDVWASS
jgi:cytochrome P450/NADPH-cytochrome P450 reductase